LQEGAKRELNLKRDVITERPTFLGMKNVIGEEGKALPSLLWECGGIDGDSGRQDEKMKDMTAI
jgi:hypothetical protein